MGRTQRKDELCSFPIYSLWHVLHVYTLNVTIEYNIQCIQGAVIISISDYLERDYSTITFGNRANTGYRNTYKYYCVITLTFLEFTIGIFCFTPFFVSVILVLVCGILVGLPETPMPFLTFWLPVNFILSSATLSLSVIPLSFDDDDDKSTACVPRRKRVAADGHRDGTTPYSDLAGQSKDDIIFAVQSV
ncbi:hypothetical protein AGLY_012912, partial [Aphis glycines]